MAPRTRTPKPNSVVPTDPVVGESSSATLPSPSTSLAALAGNLGLSDRGETDQPDRQVSEEEGNVVSETFQTEDMDVDMEPEANAIRDTAEEAGTNEPNGNPTARELHLEIEVLKWKLIAKETENRALKAVTKNQSHRSSDSEEEIRTTRALTRKDQLADARKALEDFTGSNNPVAIEQFLKKLNDYAKQAHLRDSEIIDTMDRRMKGRAYVWWSFYRDTYLAAVEATNPGAAWPVIETAFRKQFMPIRYEIDLVGRWHQYTTDGGLLTYIKNFRQFIQKVPDTPERERWYELQFKIDQNARDHLALKGVTTSMEALDTLYDFAIGHEQDSRRSKRVAVNAITADRSEKRRKIDNKPKGKKMDKSQFDNIVVDHSNYNNFEQLPVMTRSLRNFLDQNRGCRYCRKLNVPAAHTTEACAKAGKNGERDF